MESRTSFLVRLLLLALLPLSFALKFDIQAHPGAESASKERCIRNFVAKDQLVVVTATISGHRGDGQVLNLHVSGLELDKKSRKEMLTQRGSLRSRMPLAMTTTDLATSPARVATLSPLTPIPPLMSASRTS